MFLFSTCTCTYVHVCTVSYTLPNGTFNYSCSKIIKLTTHVKNDFS